MTTRTSRGGSSGKRSSKSRETGEHNPLIAITKDAEWWRSLSLRLASKDSQAAQAAARDIRSQASHCGPATIVKLATFWRNICAFGVFNQIVMLKEIAIEVNIAINRGFIRKEREVQLDEEAKKLIRQEKKKSTKD